MKLLVFVVLSVLACQLVSASGTTPFEVAAPAESIIDSTNGFFSGIADYISSIRNAITGTEPAMGPLGLTVRRLLTGSNTVGFLLRILLLDILLVPVIDMLFSVTCTGPSSSLGVVGNILWAATQYPQPVGLLLKLLGLQPALASTINTLCQADCAV